MIATRSSDRATRVLSRDDLRRVAPSIFAPTPWGEMSQRYKFVPTVEVLDVFADMGFVPVSAMQSRSRIEGKSEFTKHLVRLRHRDMLDGGVLAVGDEYPELALANSHDGTSAYQLSPAIWRKICMNGAVVQSADLGTVSIRHSGSAAFDQMVIDATYEVVEGMPKTMQAIETWKQLSLPAPAVQAFANAAKELVPEKPVLAEQLLSVRRMQDQAPSVWNVFNRVQENLIKGGLRGLTPSGKRTTTRAVNSVGENLRLNKALWRLTEELAKFAT